MCPWLCSSFVFTVQTPVSQQYPLPLSEKAHFWKCQAILSNFELNRLKSDHTPAARRCSFFFPLAFAIGLKAIGDASLSVSPSHSVETFRGWVWHLLLQILWGWGATSVHQQHTHVCYRSRWWFLDVGSGTSTLLLTKQTGKSAALPQLR